MLVGVKADMMGKLMVVLKVESWVVYLAEHLVGW